jgi:hypothetical protein
MSYFMRLNDVVKITDLESFRLYDSYTYTKEQRYSRAIKYPYTPVNLSTYTLSASDEASIVSKLPQSVTTLEKPTVLIIKLAAPYDVHPMLPPHVDYKKKCSINVYLSANDDRTEFYDWDKANKALVSKASFTAERGSFWLMDTEVPHAVHLTPGTERILVTFAFANTSFKTLSKTLTETENAFN